VAAADAAAVVGSGPSSLTGETCPHYLTFAAEDIPAGATQFKCAPPIRARDQREALWEALTTTALSMVVSDHSPAPPEIKALDTGDFSVAWGGIASLQVRLHAVWTGASVRGHGLGALAEWLADAPARLAGLDTKGSLELGKDADFVVFDPDGTLEVKARKLEHRHAITPYEGMTLRGDVAMTVLRGTTVFEKNRGVTGPSGRMLPSDD
jgi:allantoinase